MAAEMPEALPEATKSHAPGKGLKKAFGLILKVGLIGAIFYFLAEKGLLSLEATAGAFNQPWLTLPTMLVLIGLSAIGALRWQWLLRAQGMHLSYMRVLQLTYIGGFFNIALPGAVSGDVVKAFYVAHDIPGRRGHAFGAILFDRIIGLCGLVFVSAGALWLDWSKVSHSQAMPVIRIVLSSGALGILAFFGYLFLVPAGKDPLEKLLAKLSLWKPVFAGFLKTYEGVRAYQNQKATVAAALLVSIGVHLVVCWACLNFAHALGETQIPVLPVFLVVPLGILVTAVPIMPAGMGTGHMAFSWGFQVVGSMRGADIFNLWVLTNLVGGALGGLVYLAHKKKEPAPALESEIDSN